MSNLTNLYRELKRRRVFAVVALYTVAAWVVIQVGDLTIDSGIISGLTLRNLFVLAITGFPLAVIAGWFYDITRKGVVRTAPVGADKLFKTSLQLKDYLLLVVLLFIWCGTYVYVHTPPVVEKSIAIMPFENRGNDPDNAQFVLGIHDDLMTQLYRIRDLKLIAQSSVRKIDPEASVQNTGLRLGTAYIMNGSVERILNRIRVNVVLIETTAAKQTWAGSFDREFSAVNIFDIRDEITTAITKNLQTVLSPGESSRIFDLPTSSMEAYKRYLQGHRLMTSRNGEKLKQALLAFEQAVEADPEYALAWVGIADASRLLKVRDHISLSESLEKRQYAIDKALSLNDQLGEAYVSLAAMYADKGSSKESEVAYLKAIELSPNYSQAYHWYGNSLGGSPENLERELALYYKAAQLDPLSSVVQLVIGSVLQELGRFDQALDQYNNLLQMDPDFFYAYWWIGGFHEEFGRLAEAVLWFRKASELEFGPDYPYGSILVANTHLLLGDIEAAASIREETNEEFSLVTQAIRLDYNVKLAQGKLNELPGVLDRLPPGAMTEREAFQWKANAYLFSGDLQIAREYWLKWEPDWADSDQWARLIREGPEYGCNFAGILIAVGDEAGKNLLHQVIQYHEEVLPRYVKDSHRWKELGWCYLIEGSYEKALEFYEQRIEHGHFSKKFRGGWSWWVVEKLPWWEPVREHPRYIAMVQKIETKMAEQREQLQLLERTGELP